ncbi:outer membrane lipoprotein-sorting protein [uncultured Sphaerochaeta sp.]|uniref:outer membrane lipoprotein-sorting protein n=1 Tax=uncultured Sphaerochaeta sp. TaxID=886478 RepID=UPI002A0A8463|nr:outer membrane lipoprotein-sorting protein [uncultured Sphaerochaeta sp.]
MKTIFKDRKKCIFAFFLAVGISVPVFAMTGTQIMQKVYDVKEPNFTHSAIQMDLIDANGTTETRMMEQWGKEENGLASTVMVFRSPASVKDTRFLQVENEGRANDKWIYLPALRTTRRIASAEGDKSFMGTDATYDDMETRKVEADNHELLGEEKVGSYDCYKVKSVANDLSSSQYSYRISYVEKESFVPIKIEMFDKHEEPCKVLTVEKLAQQDGYWIPFVDLMVDLNSGHSTKLTILKLQLDNPISEKLFSTSFLKTGRV